jgi:DNA invertase Pin-like site-specific DNA recombinase
MTKRVAIYLRVSTDGQSVDNQRLDLEKAAERHGWEIVEVFTDKGISGSKDRSQRPGFDGLWKAIGRREVDLVAAWSVDRLGRSLQDLVAFLGELKAKGVDLYLHQQGLDTSTPAGKAMFQMMGVFAEFERAMIVERIKAGLKRARREGHVGGRPRVPAAVEAKALALLKSGRGIRSTATELGIGVSVVQRVRAQASL